MQKTYELMVLLHPDLEIDVETPISKVEGLVQATGGRVVKRDNWGKKRLAYRIARQDFAIYVYFELELDPTKISELESTIRITEEVLRHILVSQDEKAHKSEKKSDKTEKPEKADKTEKSDKKSEVTATEEGTK